MDMSFNASRFGKLIANEFQVNFRKMATMLGILFVIPVVYFALMFSAKFRMDSEVTAVIFFVIILIFQGYITNICFSDFSVKPRTLSFLLVPASSLEKYATKFLYCIIVFPLIFVIYHYLVVKFSVIYNGWGSESLLSSGIEMYEKQSVLISLSLWFFTATAYFCGAQFFKKRSATKTFLTVMSFVILFMILTPLFYFFVSGHFPRFSAPFAMIAEFVPAGGETKRVIFHSFLDESYYSAYCFSLFLSLYFMVISWFKFNEKTV